MTIAEQTERVNALACAVATLEGTAGGYSPKERMNAKMALIAMQQSETQALLQAMAAEQE